jgi:hypothetical protein
MKLTVPYLVACNEKQAARLREAFPHIRIIVNKPLPV